MGTRILPPRPSCCLCSWSSVFFVLAPPALPPREKGVLLSFAMRSFCSLRVESPSECLCEHFVSSHGILTCGPRLASNREGSLPKLAARRTSCNLFRMFVEHLVR